MAESKLQRSISRLRSDYQRIKSMGSGRRVDEAGIALSDLLPVIYPFAPDPDELLSASTAALGHDKVRSTGDLRRLLSALDRQVYPTPVSVTFAPDDVHVADLGGFRLVLDRHDASVSAVVDDRHDYEPHIGAILRRYASHGMVAVDVGANIGYHTMELARLAGREGRVIAFEPRSENCRLLLATLEANEIRNVEIVPIALGETRGWSYFTAHVGSNGGLLSSRASSLLRDAGTIVPTIALDDYLGDTPVDLIKIDVEGAEDRVLRGAHRTLKMHRPVVISEFSLEMLGRVSEVDPLSYLASFTDLGYSVSIIDRDRPGETIPYSSGGALLDAWGSDDLRIEDLLFIPASPGT